jgi:hypothetical protein
MAEEGCQNFFADQLSNSQQYQYWEPFHCETDYDLLSLGYQSPVRITSSQQRIAKLTNDKQAGTQCTQISSPLTSSTAEMSTTAWYPPGSEYSPRSQDRSRTPSLDFEPNFQTLKLGHISSTKDTEKRRQQNRNSQIAHRQRNKKLIEDLRQELTDYSVYSQDMYHTLQSLKETTKALVSTIDQALSMHPPKRNDLTTKEQKSSGNSGMSM